MILSVVQTYGVIPAQIYRQLQFHLLPHINERNSARPRPRPGSLLTSTSERHDVFGCRLVTTVIDSNIIGTFIANTQIIESKRLVNSRIVEVEVLSVNLTIHGSNESKTLSLQL